ncbi:cyclin N-terminal domain-containing protein 1 isoform X2 [Scyliorhinus canicula]|uniref:cyclin N-terminal domain-containing protein 1 isoform X2 n=1 Tax=Scyliorhinus canicula TaxID=7830 RepID=UPI0018F4D10C|nr:cyclin N-terminal domain-containing protein 1 isoform X2 [Scyliorhinus canicula]
MSKMVVVKTGRSLGCCDKETPELAFSAVSPEMLEEFLVDVAKDNERNLTNLSQHAGCFKTLRLIGSEKNTEKHGWGLLQVRIQDHFVLRIMSCVQIASKVSFHYQIVDITMALKFLQSLGYSYKREDFLDSELLVLETLSFQVNVPSPFTHTEILLEVMGYNDPSVPVEHLHGIALKVLKFVYLMRNTIYENLLKMAIENSTPSELQRAKFVTVKEDCMLLAVGVIGTSAFILNYTPWFKVVQQLASISGVTEESISEFSQVILRHIFPGAYNLK